MTVKLDQLSLITILRKEGSIVECILLEYVVSAHSLEKSVLAWLLMIGITCSGTWVLTPNY